MSKWFVQLAGDEYALETFASCFKDPELTVLKEGDAYQPVSNTFNAEDDAQVVRERTEKLLFNAMGAIRSLYKKVGSVRIAAVVFQNNDGSRSFLVTVSTEITIGTRAEISSRDANGNEQRTMPVSSKHVSLALRDSEVARVYGFWNKRPVGWDELYKIHDIIQDEMFGKMIG